MPLVTITGLLAGPEFAVDNYLGIKYLYLREREF